jgi:hypothetical protein
MVRKGIFARGALYDGWFEGFGFGLREELI